MASKDVTDPSNANANAETPGADKSAEKPKDAAAEGGIIHDLEKVNKLVRDISISNQIFNESVLKAALERDFEKTKQLIDSFEFQDGVFINVQSICEGIFKTKDPKELTLVQKQIIKLAMAQLPGRYLLAKSLLKFPVELILKIKEAIPGFMIKYKDAFKIFNVNMPFKQCFDEFSDQDLASAVQVIDNLPPHEYLKLLQRQVEANNMKMADKDYIKKICAVGDFEDYQKMMRFNEANIQRISVQACNSLFASDKTLEAGQLNILKLSMALLPGKYIMKHEAFSNGEIMDKVEKAIPEFIHNCRSLYDYMDIKYAPIDLLKQLGKKIELKDKLKMLNVKDFNDIEGRVKNLAKMLEINERVDKYTELEEILMKYSFNEQELEQLLMKYSAEEQAIIKNNLKKLENSTKK